MKTKPRIESIVKATSLDSSITGFPSFNLAELNLATDLDFQLPTNLRLGHLAEKNVAELIKSSTNYQVIYENVQVIEDKRTIGEIDFIIEDKLTKQLTHLELAYKFYLFDPHLSSESIKNWIGPNRNDSLEKKLEKLKAKQFPLLYHSCAKSTLKTIEISKVSQSLCLLVSLFIPYEYKGRFSPRYKQAIKGYYLNFETFVSLDSAAKKYHLPSKTEWGIDPFEDDRWTDFKGVEREICTSLKEKQTPLCWQKQNHAYVTFFIVWW